MKIMDSSAGTFDLSVLDFGADVIGILGQANIWLNVIHECDIVSKLHYLCSSSVQSTNQLYADFEVKYIKSSKEINKISRPVYTRGRGQRSRRRGFNYGRGNGRANYYKRRPGFTPSATQYKPSYQTFVQKTPMGVWR